jgi:hypothetical protein
MSIRKAPSAVHWAVRPTRSAGSLAHTPSVRAMAAPARVKTPDRVSCQLTAEIIYVPSDQVLSAAKATGGYSFDAPDAEFHHRPAQGRIW